jgi:hypothetical protein
MRIALPVVALAFFIGASTAHAAEPERSFARLELTAPSDARSCIQKPELEQAVERRLRRKVFREPAELLVEVRLARATNGWTAELVLLDAERRELGRRALDTAAADCSALDASIALIVALLVDAPPAPPPPPPPVETVPVESAPQQRPVLPPVPRPPPPTRIELPKDTFAPREPWRFVPMLSFSAAYDRLPGFAYGPRLGIAFLPPRFPEFRLSSGALLPREETLDDAESGGRFWLVDAALELCPLTHRGAVVRVSGCVGQSIGRLTVKGIGFDQNGEEPGLDFVLTAGASSFIALAGPLGLVIGLGAGLPLSRNTYSARTADGESAEVWQRGYFIGSGEVGLGLEL